jgi:hypothetical protein
LLLFLAVFFWSPFPLSAQPFFRGFTTLRVLQTQYFELLYPRESEETARRVSLFADRTYEEVSARLGIDVGRRIPVTIVPHIDEFNSFMNAMPYPHILLLDTPPDNEWTTFTDSLEKLFLHEMTHAVSLSTRGGALNVLHRIFGGWVYPPALNVPLFMTEGIAVSFESLDGYGRARDPLIKQKLRQESYENKFLNPYQVSGASDLSAAARGAWYEYGGLFSRYLQETYGMEKYAELWRALGNGFHFSFIFYNNGFYYYFKRIYGRSVVDVWNEFRNSLSLTDIESSEPMIVNRGLPPKPPAAASQITGMAAAGGRVFILDRFTRQLSVYNGERGKTELVIPVGTSAYDVAASSRGDYVLVSSYRYHNNRTEAVVTEYSGGSGRPRRTWRGLYRGSYFRDGVVGISSRGYQSRIVFRKGNPPGASPDRRTGLAPDEEVLLEGNGELVFSNPRPVNDSWIAFTVARRGRRELGFYHYDTGRAYTAVTDLPDDKERWEFLRYLQVCEGRLLFGYDHDDRMYKLALVDPAGLLSLPGSGEGEGEAGPGGAPALSVIFTERDFSGAVALPVLAGETLYYRGSFFGTDQLMRYPESLGALKGLTAELRLTPWDTAAMDTAEAAAPAPEVPVLSAAGGGQGTAAAPPLTPPGPEPLPGRVYLPFKYLNPLYLWLPIPLFRADPEAPLGFSLDGGGILSVMIDPPELNTISLQAAMDARFSMLDFNVEWSNANLGFPLVFKISDGVTIDSINYRAIRFGQELTLSRSLGAQGPQGFLGAGFNISRFYTQQAGGDHAAYSWDFYGNSYKFMARLGVSSLSVMPWETFGQGFTVQAVGWLLSVNNQSLPQDLYPRIDAFFQTAFEPMVPLRVSLYGAWDDYRGGMNLQGTSSQYPSPVFQPVAAAEYQTTDISGLSWIAGGEAELRLFSLNVQRSFSHLYINRLLGTLAYRAVLYDAAGFSNPEGNELGGDLRLTQSLVFRLGSGVSSVILTSAPYKVTLYLQAALKLSRFGGDAAGFTDVVAITPYIGIRY